ncbi:MAG: cyclic-di-AMP receptor [Anaerolineaceae bacterium]|nr:cyclic-di-AMP receptor [Anaerolineaceae bacterium]
MKLIITIIPGNECDNVSVALTERKFRVTKIASTGGFLRKGNATLLVGVDDDKLDEAIGLIKNSVDQSSDQQKGVLFVVKVDKFIHF